MNDDPVERALARGKATQEVLDAHKQALTEHMRALLLITGVQGLRALVYGLLHFVMTERENGTRPR